MYPDQNKPSVLYLITAGRECDQLISPLCIHTGIIELSLLHVFNKVIKIRLVGQICIIIVSEPAVVLVLLLPVDIYITIVLIKRLLGV